MKFNVGDLVTRPHNIDNREYTNRRKVRIKGSKEVKRKGPNILIGTIIDIEYEIVYLHKDRDNPEGGEYKEIITYSVVWRNWEDSGICRTGHIQRGFLEHTIQRVFPRMRTISEIMYVAKNLATQAREKQLSENELIRGQVPYITMQINTLRWVIGKELEYFRPLEKGGRLDRIGQQLQDGN